MDWNQLSTGTWVVLEYAIKIVALGVIPENRRPSSSTAWLVLIFFLPFVGLPLYLFLGSPWVQGKRYQQQVAATRTTLAYTRNLPDAPEGATPSRSLGSLLRMNRRLTGLPCVTGEVVALHSDSPSTYAAMVRAIDAATGHVHVEFYIQSWDEVTDPFYSALARAVQRGVTVRLLLDHLGSRKYPGWNQLGRRLTAAGIQWYLTMPLLPLRRRWRRPDLRNHRKILVVDGERAFIGSHNIIDPTYRLRRNIRAGRTWEDLTVEVTGSVVVEAQAVFAMDWYFESGETLDLLDAVPGAAEALRRSRGRRADPGRTRTLAQVTESGLAAELGVGSGLVRGVPRHRLGGRHVLRGGYTQNGRATVDGHVTGGGPRPRGRHALGNSYAIGNGYAAAGGYTTADGYTVGGRHRLKGGRHRAKGEPDRAARRDQRISGQGPRSGSAVPTPVGPGGVGPGQVGPASVGSAAAGFAGAGPVGPGGAGPAGAGRPPAGRAPTGLALTGRAPAGPRLADRGPVDGPPASRGSAAPPRPGYLTPFHGMDDSSLSPLVVASASVTAPAPLVNGAIPQVDDSIILPELTAQILDTAPVGTPAPQPGRPDAVVNAMQLVPSGPGYPTEPNLRLFLSLIQNATRRVSITSPYFIPDEALLSAMTTAAYRGVEVELFVGQESDQFIVNHAQRSYYSALLASGVRIYRYPAPTVLHAKYMTVDGEACVIGSANMDFRSFALNYEVMLLAFGGDLDDLLRENDAHYREISTELTAAQWAREPWWNKYIDNVCRLMSSVL